MHFDIEYSQRLAVSDYFFLMWVGVTCLSALDYKSTYCHLFIFCLSRNAKGNNDLPYIQKVFISRKIGHFR